MAMVTMKEHVKKKEVEERSSICKYIYIQYIHKGTSFRPIYIGNYFISSIFSAIA